MSDKYKITGQELNEILAYSPYALGISPGERGLSGEQIQSFFYGFIKVLAEKLNLHLQDIEKGLKETLNEAVDNAEAGITEHNKEVSAHEDIRKAVTAAYNLAAGKSRVHPVKNWQEMCTLLLSKSVGVGDLIVIAEKGYPDFAVQAVNTEAQAEDVLFFENTENIHIEPGSSYYFEEGKIRLLSLESGIDLNKLVSRDEYNFVNGQLLEQIFLHDANAEAHADIRQMIVGVANGIDGAYKNAGAALDRANSAYNLAAGNPKVYVAESFAVMFDLVYGYGTALNEGDFIIVANKNEPDFLVYSKDVQPGENAVSVSYSDILRGNIPEITVGGIYYLEDVDVAVIAIESGIDTSVFATKAELDSILENMSSIFDAIHEYAQGLIVYGKEVE